MSPDRARAERTVLTAAIRGEDILSGLKAQDFEFPIHREIFSILANLRAKGREISVEVIREFLVTRDLARIAEVLDGGDGNLEEALKELKETGRRLRLTTLEDVFQYPEPTYLINPILIEGTVSVLGAYTGIGKSILGLSIIKSALTADPLWGKYPVVKTGPVLLVDEETPQGFLRERVEKMGFEKSLPFFFLHFQEVRLDRDECFNVLMERIEEVKPVLVVIDSLIRVHRQKEDDAMQMSQVVARLRKIANSGTTVLVIHHHKKGEGPLNQKLRGSSDIPGGVDIEYALIPKDDYLIFSSVKTRTKPLEPIRLKMEISKAEIQVVYSGTEAEEILTEVRDFLGGRGRIGIEEIFTGLKERGYEIGINRLRDLLKRAVGKGIGGEQEKRKGKPWVFWALDDSSLFTPLYNAVKSEKSKEGVGLVTVNPQKEEGVRELSAIDSQGLADSSRAKIDGLREESIEDEIPIGEVVA